MNPNDSEAHFQLSNLYHEQNKFQLAENHLKKALELEPSNAYYWYFLAIIQTDLSKRQEALNSLEKSIPLIKNDNIEGKTKAIYYKGVLLLSLREKAEALKIADELTKINTTAADQLKELASFQ